MKSGREWMVKMGVESALYFNGSLTSGNVKLNKCKYRYFGIDISVLEYLFSHFLVNLSQVPSLEK